jgi:hypothetical protein
MRLFQGLYDRLRRTVLSARRLAEPGGALATLGDHMKQETGS